MPTPRKPGKKSDALAKARERIARAEKAQAPVGRELVALDSGSYDLLVVCVEGGLGKKPGVLMQALAIGLQAMANTISDGMAAPEEPRPSTGSGTVVNLFPREPDEASEEKPAGGLLAGVQGGSFAFEHAPATIQTPSQRRRARLAAGEDAQEDEGDDDAT